MAWAMRNERAAELAIRSSRESVKKYLNVCEVAMTHDDTILPIVKEVNHVHHIDGARHIDSNHRPSAEAFAESSLMWSAEMLDTPYEVRKTAMAHEVCAANRRRVSQPLINDLLKKEFLIEAPVL